MSNPERTQDLAWLPAGYDPGEVAQFKRPIQTFLIKIASLCNLNCSYCYVYQSPDVSWSWKPKFLEPAIARSIAMRIQEHATSHQLSEVTILFHGGEPLLAGPERLRALIQVFESTITCPINWGLQTNGTLLDADLADLLAEHRFCIGISLDGLREHNDRHRLYHNGASSYDESVDAIRRLKTYPNWNQLFGGVLVVIDIRNKPSELLEAMQTLGVHRLNVLLPDAHHDSPPPFTGEPVAYGKWLSELFDIWYADYPDLEVRYFEQIIAMMLGGVSTAEEIGAESVDLVVVETNGDIEAVDTLKIVGRRATATGMNVESHSFDQTLSHPSIGSRMAGFDALCESCRTCEYLKNCGGGYLPHRFSEQNGFMNPSVYCGDLKYLFSHIRQKLFRD